MIPFSIPHTVRLLGVGGQMGAGKTTAAHYLAAQGVYVLDADNIAHQVFDNKDFLSQVRTHFGTWAVRDGMYDRTAMRTHLQTHPDDFNTLNAITHPLIYAQINRLLLHAPSRTALITPLLAQSPIKFYKTLWIHTPLSLLYKRLSMRGLDDAYINTVLARQPIVNTDFVIDNGTNIANFHHALDNIITKVWA